MLIKLFRHFDSKYIAITIALVIVYAVKTVTTKSLYRIQ